MKLRKTRCLAISRNQQTFNFLLLPLHKIIKLQPETCVGINGYQLCKKSCSVCTTIKPRCLRKKEKKNHELYGRTKVLVNITRKMVKLKKMHPMEFSLL